jgi:hypothetical protein
VKNVLRSARFTLPKSSETVNPPSIRPVSPEAAPLQPRRLLNPLQPSQRFNTSDISAEPPYAHALPKRVSITGKLDHRRSASGTLENTRKGTTQPPDWLAKALAVSSSRRSARFKYALKLDGTRIVLDKSSLPLPPQHNPNLSASPNLWTSNMTVNVQTSDLMILAWNACN